MVLTLAEMKRKNIASGGHFFEKDKPKILNHYGNYIITKSIGEEGYLIYKFDPDNGRINLVDNPEGEYSWEPYKNKLAAIAYARKLNKNS